MQSYYVPDSRRGWRNSVEIGQLRQPPGNPGTGITAVVKNVVGKHYFLAVFGPIDAHFSSQPLRQPHGMTVSHIVKLNHTVIKKELKLG